ncbi:MAG: MlaD family protein [Actinomycetota bacterium]|nr:MlaD family protein [Actinomycetota bacterium]
MLRVVTLGVLVCAIVFVASLVFNSNGGHKYTFDFQNAAGIVSGNLVMVGGHPVGSVKSVKLSDDNRARMEVELDEPIHEGTTALIRRSSLSSVHNHYVAMTPGPDNKPELEEGTVLGEGDTVTAVELDQIFDMFDPKTRKGWSDWIQGIASIYRGEGGPAANKTSKYSGASFSSTQRLMAELSDQDVHLDRFVKNTSGFVTNLAEVAPELTELVSNANTALGAIAQENESLSLALQELPPTLRQANTTFVNLRAALDDVEPLYRAQGRAADAGLANFLKNDVRPVLKRARPVFSDLADANSRPGPNNDLSDLLSSMIPLHDVAQPAVNAAVRGMDASQEEVSETRAYSPDIFGAFARLAGITANYDGAGHYARVRPTATGPYQLNGGSIEPRTSAIYGGLNFLSNFQRCPGGATQPIAGSNPFLDNGNLTGKCDPSQVP